MGFDTENGFKGKSGGEFFVESIDGSDLELTDGNADDSRFNISKQAITPA